MKELFGKNILKIYISEDKRWLAFIEPFFKEYIFHAFGECCSDTWFESINNPENIINSEIIGIEIKPELQLEEDQIKEDQECVKAYGYTFKTAKGYCDVEFRNNSNGYYGGGCEISESAQFIWPKGMRIDMILSGDPLQMWPYKGEPPVIMKPYPVERK